MTKTPQILSKVREYLELAHTHYLTAMEYRRRSLHADAEAETAAAAQALHEVERLVRATGL